MVKPSRADWNLPHPTISDYATVSIELSFRPHRELQGVGIQNVLAQKEWKGRMATEDFRALTPLIHSHVNPYGSFELDMDKNDCPLTN